MRESCRQIKLKKYGIQTAVGFAVAFAVMWERGLGDSENMADMVLAVCDGFSVTALLYLSVGILIWISTTDFFDIFSYALQKGAHAILPMAFKENLGKYYDYKVQKEQMRRGKSGKETVSFSKKSTLAVGLFFLLVSILMTAVWYLLTDI